MCFGCRDVHNREHDQTGEEIMAYILERCRALVPSFDAGKVIHAFAGARCSHFPAAMQHEQLMLRAMRMWPIRVL